MDVSEAKQLKQLEDENAKLKKLLAKQMFEAAALRELLSKKCRARRQAEGVAHLRAGMGLSERRPARSSALIGIWSATACVGRRTPSFGRNCETSPTRERVSDIVGCSSCCGRRQALGHQSHLSPLS